MDIPSIYVEHEKMQHQHPHLLHIFQEAAPLCPGIHKFLKFSNKRQKGKKLKMEINHAIYICY